MKKLLITNLLTAFLVALLIGTTAFGATVLFPSGGGTGTNTKPAKGSILVGTSTTAYYVMASGTVGYVLTSTTTSPYVSWEVIASGGITSLNDLTGSSQTFVNDTNIGITSTSTTHTIGWIGTLADGRIASAGTWNAKQNAISFPISVASTSLTGGVGLTLTTNDMACDTSSGSVFGCLASADWTTFNNKQVALTFPLASASSSAAGSNTQIIYNNGGINAGDANLTWKSSSQLLTITGSSTFSGFVGIGTTAPSSTLHIIGGAQISNLNINGLVYASSTGILAQIATSTPGRVLMATSTFPGMSWETLAGGITSLGSQTGASQAFATSTSGSGIAITSSGDVHTFKIGKNLDIINAAATTTNSILIGSNASGWTSSAATGTQATALSLGNNAYNSTAFLSSATATSSKSITVESPTATENITIFTPKYPITINRVSCINNPVSGNSVTFNLKHATTRATTATSTDVFGVNQVCSATSTPTYWTAADFNDATLAVDEMMWIITSAASSTAISISIDYLYD